MRAKINITRVRLVNTGRNKGVNPITTPLEVRGLPREVRTKCAKMATVDEVRVLSLKEGCAR